MACEYDHFETVKILLERGAEIEVKGKVSQMGFRFRRENGL